MANVQIFLSTVTAEFLSYREDLRSILARPNVTVKVQEDFFAAGTPTLIKLDDYIRECDVVIHLVGDMTGGWAKAPSVSAIQGRYPDFATRFPMLEPFLEAGGPEMSYTQWEAWLALYHYRVLIIATPTDDAPRDELYQLIGDQRAAQQAHLIRMKEFERYPEVPFASVHQLASELWRSTLHDIIPQRQPPTAGLGRVREMASTLLDVGRDTWKMPQFIAPLNLAAQEKKVGCEPNPTNITALAESVGMGGNLVLFGEGGIGKTTFLLELSGVLLAEKCPRIPLYIDAAYWANTNTEIFDYIAGRPTAQQHKVTSSELMKLATSGCLTLMVNGWNEMTAIQKIDSSRRFVELTTTIPFLNIVIVTRSVADAPAQKAGQQVHVRGLTWQAQTEVIRSELDEALAKVLIELLARDIRLRDSARSPLILKGLLAQAKKGEVASACTFDLLGAVVDSFEDDDQRRPFLEGAPLRNQHRHFLEELAYHLTSKQETTSSCPEVLPVISGKAKQLVNEGAFTSPPDPSDVLDALSNHHLLHKDDQTVRFAHHRFQEYFSATRLFRACVDGDEHDIALLRETVNQPFWEDALLLVGDKLKDEEGNSQARSRLVKTALEVDLGFACDLAGACALSVADDSDLYNNLVAHINVLCDSPLCEVANYGVVCIIASGFTVFADRLWPLIESDDSNTRFNTYRLNKSRISLQQFGEEAEERIAAWAPERQAELIHELAENPDNYDFLVRAANEAVEDEVRAAAISALAWNFPASEATLQAWLNAPVDVQLEHNVIGVVRYALELGAGSDEVREKLRNLSREQTSEESQLRLALDFPDEIGPNAIETVLDRLRESKDYGGNTSLETIAMKHAPDRLNALARELMLSERVVPDWACKVVQQESAETRTEIFDAAWAIIHGKETLDLSAKVVGPLASRGQTLRSVREWLKHCQDRYGDLPEVEREIGRQVGYLLANAPGDDLLSVAMELGEDASYNEASELLDLVRHRIGQDDIMPLEIKQWLPSTEAVHELIETFGKKSDDAKIPQHTVHVYLCCIASYVSPAEFGGLLLEGFILHLDAWETFCVARDEWIKLRTGDRPSNPSLGNYISSSMERWGFEALPGLLELFGHPQANQLIPEVVKRIVSQPWLSKKKGPSQILGTDFKDGEERRLVGRALHQPDDTHQEITDIAARALGTKLTELVQRLRVEKTEGSGEWNENRAIYRMCGLLNAVANIPSTEIIKPLMHALTYGFIDIRVAVNALKDLVRQGVFIEDAAVVARVESLYAEEAKEEWIHDSAHYTMATFCKLTFYVRPASLLSKSLNDYLAEWQRFAHFNEVIRHLGDIPSEESWRCIMELGKGSAVKGRSHEQLFFALVEALSPDNFTEFLSLIADGTLFSWCQSAWNLKRIAPGVLRIIDDDTTRLDAFLDVCEGSSSPFADVFACEVLILMPDGDPIRLRYGLAALDEGRVKDSHSPVYSMLEKMFTLYVPLSGEGHYEMHPKADSNLRRHLYSRAKEDESAATISRRLLADVECQRWEGDRPKNEPRHPDVEDGVAWTEVLTCGF